MMNLDVHDLYEAIYNQIIFIMSKNITLTQNELEHLLRSDLEKAMASAMATFMKEGQEAGMVEDLIKIGSNIYSKEEFVDILVEGLDHPGCLSKENIVEGLSLYFESYLDDSFLCTSDDGYYLNITRYGELVAVISVSDKKIVMRKLSDTIDGDEILINQILPIVICFVDHMKESAKFHKKDTKEDDDSFEWI